MSFTAEEIAYLKSQPLARIATVSPEGQPDAVPVGFEFDGTYFYVGGIDPAKTRRHRNVRAGNTQVALIIDDLVSIQPWTPRFLRVYGTAELIERNSESPYFSGSVMRITPTISWSWNLDAHSSSEEDFGFAPRRTVHHAPALS
jgi:pyridoxamine 5'-phosphate oxidase family protein